MGHMPMPPQRPPPAYPTQVKEELEEGSFYGQCPSVFSTIEAHGHYGSMHGVQQGRLVGGNSTSSPHDRGYWPQSGSQTPPATPLWCHSPTEMTNYTSGQAAHFMYPAEQQMYMTSSNSHTSTPDTPDSGYWDVSLDNSPGQYTQLEESWSGHAVDSCGESKHPGLEQLAPLPELSLQEILGELDEEWLGGEEQLWSVTSGEHFVFLLALYRRRLIWNEM